MTPGLVRRARRPVFGVSDQVLNAATNAATVYLGSLLLRPDRFGTFALAVAIVTIVLAAGRGLVGSTMMVELPALAPSDARSMVRSAVGFTVLVGVVAALVLFLAGDETVRAFAPWVPVALLQDVGRHAFLAVRRQGSALLLDVAWAAVQGLAVGLWLFAGRPVTTGVLATCWGLGALAGLGLFAVLSDTRPARPGPWLRSTRDVAGWFTAVAMTAQVELYLVLLLTSSLLGPAEAGGLRSAQLLAYQPALVLLGSLAVLLTPLMVGARGSPVATRRAWWRILAACSPVVVGLMLVAVLREPLMSVLFGQYVAFASLVVPIALQGICSVLAVPSLVMLRAYRRGRVVFVLQAVRAALMVGAAFAGLLLGGAVGLAWGLAVGSAANLLVISASALLAARRDGVLDPAAR